MAASELSTHLEPLTIGIEGQEIRRPYQWDLRRGGLLIVGVKKAGKEEVLQALAGRLAQQITVLALDLAESEWHLLLNRYSTIAGHRWLPALADIDDPLSELVIDELVPGSHLQAIRNLPEPERSPTHIANVHRNLFGIPPDQAQTLSDAWRALRDRPAGEDLQVGPQAQGDWRFSVVRRKEEDFQSSVSALAGMMRSASALAGPCALMIGHLDTLPAPAQVALAEFLTARRQRHPTVLVGSASTLHPVQQPILAQSDFVLMRSTPGTFLPQIQPPIDDEDVIALFYNQADGHGMLRTREATNHWLHLANVVEDLARSQAKREL